ncbi:MAG: methylglyoxal synthase [Ruminococcaceae bacterium]|nr:methylglyoxal synthase [Oscillospiraceae bacterium]
MNIVLMADHRKHELLVNFCIAYSQILSRHTMVSLFNTARLIRDATNLEVTGLSTEISGSIDQLASRASYNEIDAVIYLRDPLLETYDMPNALLKSCDTNSIPLATNLATAELLVLALDRGDLDWRELVR